MQKKTDNPIDKHFRDVLGQQATPPPDHLEEQVLGQVAPPAARPLSLWAWCGRAAVLLWLVSLGLDPVGPASEPLWPEKGGAPQDVVRKEPAGRPTAPRLSELSARNLAPLPPAPEPPALETQALAWTPAEPKAATNAPERSGTVASGASPGPGLAVAVKMPPPGYFADEQADSSENKPLVRYARHQWERLRHGEKPTLPPQWKEKPILAFNLPKW